MDNLEPDSGTLVDSQIGNYYGNFAACLIKGVPHISVQNYDGFDWEACSMKFYKAIVDEFYEADI